MLKKVTERTDITNRQIQRCEDFLSLVDEMRRSETINLNVVDTNGFKCWFGLYIDRFEQVPFDFDRIAAYLGCRPEEAETMFGPASSGTLTERTDLMRAHLYDLKRSVFDLE